MQIKNICRVLFILSFLCCTDKKDIFDDPINEVKIECIFEERATEIGVSSFASRLEYVVIPESISSSLNSIIGVVKAGDFVGIFGFDSAYLFNASSGDLEEIGSRGKGPGEYLGVVDIDIELADSVLVLTDMGSKIIVYNLTDLSLHSEFTNDLYASKCRLLKGHRMFQFVPTPLYIEHQHSIWITDLDNRSREKYWLRSESRSDLRKFTGTTLPVHLENVNQGFNIFSSRLSSMFYFDLETRSISCTWKFTFGDSPENLLDPNFDESTFFNQKTNKKYISHAFVLSQSKFFFTVRGYNSVDYGYWEEKTGLCANLGSIFSAPGFIDDLDQGPKILPKGKLSRNEAYDFITVRDYVQIVEQESDVQPVGLRAKRYGDDSKVLRIIHCGNAQNED